MVKYSYTGSNTFGEEVEGEIDADSISAAQMVLEEKGIVADEIFEVSDQIVQPSLPEDIQSDPVVSFADPLAIQPEDISPSYTEEPVEEPHQQSGPVEWKEIDESNLHTVVDSASYLPPDSPHVQTEEASQYFPLSETLRLYAGWLLSWYVLVYAVGAYQATRNLPFSIPYIEAWLPLYSPLILTFAAASFLYLLFSSIHSWIGGGRFQGTILTLVGIVTFVLFRINV